MPVKWKAGFFVWETWTIAGMSSSAIFSYTGYHHSSNNGGSVQKPPVGSGLRLMPMNPNSLTMRSISSRVFFGFTPGNWGSMPTGAHYLNADTTAFMQCLTSDLFTDFPTLRFIIPHGGGAVPYHWGRFRGLAQELKKPLLKDHLLKNIYFDTCVYHQPGIDLLTKVIPVDNILFASEMIGAVRGIDPETGNYYDDTKRYIEASTIVVGDDRHKIYEGNTRRVFPRLDAALKAKGK